MQQGGAFPSKKRSPSPSYDDGRNPPDLDSEDPSDEDQDSKVQTGKRKRPLSAS